MASSSWQQLPDGFLALSLPDEFKLGSVSTPEDPAGGSPTDGAAALAELPTVRLQVNRSQPEMLFEVAHFHRLSSRIA